MAECNYNCVALPDHVRVECGEYIKGGVSAIGILDCDHTITDFNSQAQLESAIANNQLTIIKGIKGQTPEASPVLNPNPVGCGSETVLDGFDRTVTWMDSNVSNSVISFYNALNRRAEFLLVYHCEEEELTIIEVPVTFEAHRVVPESNKERQVYNVTASYSDFDDPPLQPTVASVFT